MVDFGVVVQSEKMRIMIVQIIPSTRHLWCRFMCWVALVSTCAFLCDCNWIFKSTNNSKYLIFFLENNHVVYWQHQQCVRNNVLFGVLNVIIMTCQLKGLFYVALELASFQLSFRNNFLLLFFHFWTYVKMSYSFQSRK
jgi:hypothetical protein